VEVNAAKAGIARKRPAGDDRLGPDREFAGSENTGTQSLETKRRKS